jgi:hypothetical protein
VSTTLATPVEQPLMDLGCGDVLGTAIYVYCIIVNQEMPSVVTTTNLSLSLDGVITDPAYVHTPDGIGSTDGFLYNVPVYSNTSLENTNHTLVFWANAQQGSAVILFDYVTYTFVCCSGSNECAGS